MRRDESSEGKGRNKCEELGRRETKRGRQREGERG